MSLAEKLELQRQIAILLHEKSALYQQLATESERMFRIASAHVKAIEIELKAVAAEAPGEP